MAKLEYLGANSWHTPRMFVSGTARYSFVVCESVDDNTIAALMGTLRNNTVLQISSAISTATSREVFYDGKT